MNHMQQQTGSAEFLKWIPVTGEKHVGIAIVRYERRFIFRFKILPSEQGGYWATTASLKTGVYNGKDKYENAFSLDSDYEKDALNEFVIENVMAHMNRVNPMQPASVFSPQPVAQPPQQPNPNYGHYQQPQQQPPFAQRPEYQQGYAQPAPADNLPF